MQPIIGLPTQIPYSVRDGIYADCLMPVVETVRLLVEDPFQQGEASVSIFVIPAPHRVRDKLQWESSFFALDPCSPLSRGQVYTCEGRCRGDIVDFCFLQQILI